MYKSILFLFLSLLLSISPLLAQQMGMVDRSFSTGEGIDGKVLTLVPGSNKSIIIGGDFEFFDGEKIESLVNSYQNSGSYTVQFDAIDMASGVYLYRLITDSQVISKTMLLIK